MGRSRERQRTGPRRVWELACAGRWDYVNRCSVRDHQGNEVWTHDKLAEFNITEENVAQSDFLKASGFDATGGVEGIRSGTRLEICDCALGRVAVAICVGFFHRPLEDLLVKSGATLFLVPAMSPDLERMHERAHALVGSQHAAVVVANCAKAGQGKDKGRSFYLLPETNAQPVPIENNQKLLVLKIKRPRSRITTPLTIN